VLEYPRVEPGPAHCWVSTGRVGVSNRVLSAVWNVSERGLQAGFIRDGQTGRSLTLTGELFQIVLKELTRYRASDLRPKGAPAIVELQPEPSASRLAGRIRGERSKSP
jgi:hypothetical protein